MTKQRQLILDLVRSSPGHPTAEQIYLQAKAVMPAIAMATVYNSLHYLTQQNLIRRVKIHGAPDHYDHAVDEHQHLICDGCGAISDIHLPDFLGPLRQAGCDIRGYELNIHHLCKNCKKQGGNAHGSESNV